MKNYAALQTTVQPSGAKPKTVGKVVSISVLDIIRNPQQPRKFFDDAALASLSTSIRENGILQPLSVRATAGGKYELVAGERRLRAALLAGLSCVPCIVLDTNARQCDVLSLLENLQREDLNCFEEAAAIKRLLENGEMTQYELAKKLGKAQSTLANKLRLLTLTPAEQQLILEKNLTERHARALVAIDQPEKRMKLLEEICAKRLNVSQTDALVEQYLASTAEQSRPSDKKPVRVFLVRDIRIFVNSINRAVKAMQIAGIAAITQTRQTDDMLEYTIRIPTATPAKTVHTA